MEGTEKEQADVICIEGEPATCARRHMDNKDDTAPQARMHLLRPVYFAVLSWDAAALMH